MKKCYLKIVSGTALAVMFCFASCHSPTKTKAEVAHAAIDLNFIVAPDAGAMALLALQGEDRQYRCAG